MTDFLAETTDLLRRTPDVLRALLVGLPDSWGDTPDKEGGWRPRDVVGHLVTAELDNYLARAEHILEHGTSAPFEPFDRFAFRRTLAGVALPSLLETFARLRASNLEALRALALQPAQLAARGTHPSLGTVTLEQLLSTWVVHDLGHLAQIARVMSKQYREDVGPWREYLPVLDRR